MLLIYFLCLCTFGTTSTVLNQSRKDDSAAAIVVTAFGNPLIDSIVT